MNNFKYNDAPKVRRVTARHSERPVDDRSFGVALPFLFSLYVAGVCIDNVVPESGVRRRTIRKKRDTTRSDIKNEGVLLYKGEELEKLDWDFEDKVGGLKFGNERLEVRDHYLKKGAHPYTIYPVEETVLIGKSDTKYTTYWMPQYGFCSKIATLFHFMVSGREYNHDGWDLMWKVFELVDDKLEYVERSEDEELEGIAEVSTLAEQYMNSIGMSAEDREIPVYKALKHWEQYGVPIAANGSEGLVFARQGDLLHVGYRCRWTKSAFTGNAKITDNGLKDILGDLWTDFVLFVSRYRPRRTPKEDSPVGLPLEVKEFLRSKSESYNIMLVDTVNGKPYPYDSNNGFGENSKYRMLYKSYALDFVPIVDEKAPEVDKAKKVEEVFIPDDPTKGKKTDYVLLRSSYKPNFLYRGHKWYRKGKSIVRRENKVEVESIYALLPGKYTTVTLWDTLYDIVDVEPVDGIEKVTLQVHVRDSVVMEDPYGVKLEADRIVAPSEKHQFGLDEWFNTEGRAALVSSDFALAFEKAFNYISTIVDGAHIPSDWLEQSLILKAQERRDRVKKFNNVAGGNFIKAWFLAMVDAFKTKVILFIFAYFIMLWGKFREDPLDIPVYKIGAWAWRQAVRTAVTTSAKIIATIGLIWLVVWSLIWVLSTALITVSSLWLLVQVLVTKLCIVFDIMVIVRSIIMTGDYTTGPLFATLYKFYFFGQTWALILFIFLIVSCSLALFFGGMVAQAIILKDPFKIGRSVVDTKLRQELSAEKLSDLLVTPDWLTFSMSNLRCYWRKKAVSFQYILRKSINHKLAPFKKEQISSIVDPENDKFMHKIAPASRVGSLWAFLVRACSPVAVPKIEHRNMMKDYKGTELFINNMKVFLTEENWNDFNIYLAQVLRRKRHAYSEGLRKFMDKPRVPSTMDIVVKPDEKQHHQGVKGNIFSMKYKPRNIFNPSEQVKGVGGWIMWNIMSVVKKHSMFKDNFAAGKSPEELEEIMTSTYRRMRKPKFMFWDGHRHDSLQHAWFLEHVDNKVLRELVPIACRLAGFNYSQTQALLKNLTALTIRVRLMAKTRGFSGKSDWMKLLETDVFGTVFSGHPSRTTFGNTLRILLLSHFAASRVSIRWNVDMFHFQAGDDTVIIIEEDCAALYEQSVKWVYEHYGLVMTDFGVGDKFEFLSRNGWFENGRVHLIRQADRVAQTGLYSTKVDEPQMPAFDSAITGQLAAWGSDFTGVREVVNYRKSKSHVKYTDKDLAKIHVLLEDQWSILLGEHTKRSSDPLVGLEPGYRLLAATGGDINHAIQRAA